MIPVPSGLDHLPIIIELIRDGKDLSQYHKFMDHYRASLEAAMNSFELATDALVSLAADDA